MNTRTTLGRSLIGLIAASVIAGALVGCTSSSGEAVSRAKPYNSVSELSSDSSFVVSGTVDSQQQVAETDSAAPYVASTFTVAATYTPAGLGTTAPSGEVKLRAGDTIVVRQIGGLNSTGAPKLRSGTGYLLFLVQAGLPGTSADTFYITGATAGLYESTTGAVSPETAGAAKFTRLSDDGDKLPATLSEKELG